jgi:hypothetical protein
MNKLQIFIVQEVSKKLVDSCFVWYSNELKWLNLNFSSMFAASRRCATAFRFEVVGVEKL